MALFLGMVLLIGCTQQAQNPPTNTIVQAPANASGSAGMIVGSAHSGALSAAAAQAIAQGSPCMAVGNLTGSYTYNNISGTWWFDLDTVKAGCSPACVVYEANGSAGVNWRCTGATVPSPAYTVNTANLTGFGQVLTGGNGLTLYVFTADAVNQSNCAGTCATVWPPLLVSNGQINYPSGLPGSFGAIARKDGTIQVTYNGMPLYYYESDSAPGDTKGQGLNGKWFVAQTNLTTFP